MKKFVKLLKSEQANATVEAVVVFPIVFVAIFTVITVSFMMHDRATYEAAAKRGAIYASHCIANPNYENIVRHVSGDRGLLDMKQVEQSEISFSGIGENIQPYRYFQSTTPGLEDSVKKEVLAILDKTRMKWFNEDTATVTIKQENKIFYQDVSVSIQVSYPLPKIFGIIGLPDKYEYTATAKMTVNDPDEFIRNVDLVIDVIATLDEKITGGKISEVTSKLSGAIEKAKEWLKF